MKRKPSRLEIVSILQLVRDRYIEIQLTGAHNHGYLNRYQERIDACNAVLDVYSNALLVPAIDALKNTIRGRKNSGDREGVIALKTVLDIATGKASTEAIT